MTEVNPPSLEAPPRERKPRGRAAFEAFSVSSLGLEMGAATFIGWGIGSWLDHRYESAPSFTLVFLLLGVAAGFRGLYRVAKQTKANTADSNE